MTTYRDKGVDQAEGEGMTDAEPNAELAAAERAVVEWAINWVDASSVSWREMDISAEQLDLATRALIRLRAARE